MVNIPCVLECEYQKNGLCHQNTASVLSCINGKCPYYLEKDGTDKMDNKKAVGTNARANKAQKASSRQL